MEHSTINVKPIYLSYILHLILKASSAALQASPDVKHHNPLSNTLPMQSPIRDSQNPMQSNLSGRSSGKTQLKNLPTKTNQKSDKRGRRTKKKKKPFPIGQELRRPPFPSSHCRQSGSSRGKTLQKAPNLGPLMQHLSNIIRTGKKNDEGIAGKKKSRAICRPGPCNAGSSSSSGDLRRASSSSSSPISTSNSLHASPHIIHGAIRRRTLSYPGAPCLSNGTLKLATGQAEAPTTVLPRF